MTNPAHGADNDKDFPCLSVRAGGILTVTLNRPAAYNAFDAALKSALLDTLASAASDPTVRVVVLAGAGRAFCAGQDLKEHATRVAANDPAVKDTVAAFYNPLITTVMSMPKPVIASLGGVAAGAGAALAFACDFRIASTDATFALAFAGAGLSADSGASFTLPRLIGTGRALQLMLLGDTVTAEDALRIGLVSDVVAPTELTDRTTALAMRLAGSPTGALGWIKQSVHFAAAHTLEESLAFESDAQRTCFASADHREALNAFLEKRAPQFQPATDVP